jgi:hypothetical protein
VKKLAKERVEPAAVRIGTIAIIGLAAVTPAFLGVPDEPPAYALHSELILYLERSFLIFVLGYLLLTALVRGVSRGAIPNEITRDGMKWAEEVTEVTVEAIDALQLQIDTLETDIRELAQRALLKPPQP